jgi:hypothetical protein
LYNTKNPFDWMELISLRGKLNSNARVFPMDARQPRLASGEVASWHSLPLDVKEHVWQLMVTELPRDCRLAMRSVCRSWEAWHDGRCRTLKIPQGVDDNFREVFGRFSGLTELQIRESHTLTGYGLWRLASVGLSALTALDLSYSYEECSQLDDGFEALSLGGFPVLRSLKLAGCEVTDAALKKISNISTLTELDIGRYARVFWVTKLERGDGRRIIWPSGFWSPSLTQQRSCGRALAGIRMKDPKA